MKSPKGQAASWLLSCTATLLLFLTQSAAQESVSKRKLLDHTPPSYPALARNMGLQGVVKLDVLVLADGTVKTAGVQGGHPVLAQAAVSAVRQWRWEARTHESHEIVQVKFAPND